MDIMTLGTVQLFILGKGYKNITFKNSCILLGRNIVVLLLDGSSNVCKKVYMESKQSKG